MATKNFYATGDFRYGTRMLRAGDGPFPMDGPTARLYTALGKISTTKPKGAAAPAPETAPPPPPKAPAAPKKAPAKRKASAKKKAAPKK